MTDPALAPVGEAMAALRAEIPEVRWVRPEGIHVSLHFFGRLAEEDVPRALAAAAPAAAAIRPFTVQLSGYGSFPGRGTPRVLWLGVGDGSAVLDELARGCCAGLAAAGFEVEERPFTAHCTLGRPPPEWPPASRRAWQRTQAPVFPPFVADRLVLFESRPGPGGSVYVERAALPFGAPSEGGSGGSER